MTDVILQISPPGTASTVLVNYIIGAIKPNLYVKLLSHRVLEKEKFTQIVYKSHNKDFLPIIATLSKKHNIYIVSSHREQRKYDFDLPNVLSIDYEQLQTKTQSIEKVSENIHKKLQDFLPSGINFNKDTAIKRLYDMEAVYQKIKDRPFSYYNKKFHIHGSHRNRSTMNK